MYIYATLRYLFININVEAVEILYLIIVSYIKIVLGRFLTFSFR